MGGSVNLDARGLQGGFALGGHLLDFRVFKSKTVAHRHNMQAGAGGILEQVGGVTGVGSHHNGVNPQLLSGLKGNIHCLLGILFAGLFKIHAKLLLT